MPKLIDRRTNMAKVQPVAMRLIADEGPAAVTFRRISAETGMSLSAVRNMWPTQQDLVQAGSARAFRLVQVPPLWFPPTARPDDLLVTGLLRLLPLTDEVCLAHRCLAALRQGGTGSPFAGYVAGFERERACHVLHLIEDAQWLQLPEPRPGRGYIAQDDAERRVETLPPAAVAALVLVTGLSAVLSLHSDPITPAVAEDCVRRMVPGLLDSVA